MAQTIGLNMIVKNEAHVILQTLEKIIKKIKFDYWCISDTGSTDGTQDIIRTFFATNGIPGELVEHEWVDFGYNRTKAIECAYDKCDYLFIFDADDELCGDFVIPVLKADGYKLNFGDSNGVSYSRVQVVNNRKKWCYKGVLHEFIQCLEPNCQYTNLDGTYYIISGKTGARSQDPQKYYKDALILEKAHATAIAEKDDLYVRYAFYCANSYHDCNRPEDAIKWYKTTLSQTNWAQEKYIACLRLYESYTTLNKKEEGMYYLVESYKYDMKRLECAYHLIKHYCVAGMPEVARMYYFMVKNWYETQYLSTVDFSNFLFISVGIYAFYLPYYMIIVFATMHAYEDGLIHFRILFNKKYMCDSYLINIVLHNFVLYIPTLVSINWSEKIPFLTELLNYVDYVQEHKIQIKQEYIQHIHKLIEQLRPVITALPVSLPSIKEKQHIQTILTITTCKRLDLFKQTMNSILNTWGDLDKVDYFLCIDDCSSEEDRTYMRETYPFLDFYMKTSEEKGHRSSMNIIWHMLNNLKPTYWIHLEDDWVFIKKDNYVSKGIECLEKYKSSQNIHQILFNRNYAETYDLCWQINGGELIAPGILKHEKSESVHGPNCAYWPHYSFRPSIICVDTILKLGDYNSPNNFFERDYADRYYEQGYRSAFFNGISSIHIGKLTSDKTSANAYTLNDMVQFENKKESPVKIINLKRRPDRKQKMTELFKRHRIPNYEIVEAVDGLSLELTLDIYQLFKGNDFGNRKCFIGCALTHYRLWKQLILSEHNQFTIFEDDIQIEPEFGDKLKQLEQDITATTDILFLGSSCHPEHNHLKFQSSVFGNLSVPLDRNKYIGGFFGYIITKKGATKMLDYIAKNGIRHGIDYLVKIIPELECISAQPHIVYTDVVFQGSPNQDSNIQLDVSCYDFDSITNKDNWEFIPGFDMTDNDIGFVGRKSIEELMVHAHFTPKCVAFNTLGFLKNVYKELKQSPYFREKDGVYVKRYKSPLPVASLPVASLTTTTTMLPLTQKKIRVRMTGNYWNSRELCEEWNNLTQGNYTWNNIQFTWETNDIDYYVIINRPCDNDYYDPARTIIFHMEPWCFNLSHNWGVKTWGQWATPDESKFLQVRSHRNHYNNGFWQLKSTYKDLKNMTKIQKYEHSIVSTICSSKYFDEGHIKRIDFLKFLEKKEDPVVSVHYYNHDNIFQFKNYMGGARPNIDKEKGMMKYKYYFMCENNTERNFITEKLWEPILCGCLCFYWGCPNVADYIDPRAFVQLDMDDFEKSFQIMKTAISENWWESRFPYIIEERNKILEYYAFCPTVERVIQQDIITKKQVKTACFIHSCNINPTSTYVLDKLLNSLKESGLYDALDMIVINNIGHKLSETKYKSDDKIQVIYHSPNSKLFERPTLELMHTFSKNNPHVKLLYLHTKGICYNPTFPIYNRVQSWVNYMLYFLTNQYANCLTLLNEYDSVGCNYYEGPHKHWSGNFWWVKSDYFATLNINQVVYKTDAEWLVLSGSNVRFKELHRSNVDHYQTLYEKKNYI